MQNHNPVKSARQGMRVELITRAVADVPAGTFGTIAKFPGGIGSNPNFVFVDWDNGLHRGTFKRDLAKTKRGQQLRSLG